MKEQLSISQPLNVVNLSSAFDTVNTPKLKWMFKVFDKRIMSRNSSIRWTMLGGHDTDIYPFLIDLNISSSACIEELYRFGKTNALNC